MSVDNFNDITSKALIKNVEFYYIGDTDITQNSNSKVLNSKTLKDNSPIVDGIYNINLGTTDNKFKCHTCYNYKTLCPGHSGHIESPYPLVAPFGKKELLKWLKILCFNCGNTILENDKPFKMHLKKIKNVKELSCYYCSHLNEKIYWNVKNSMFLMMGDKEEEVRVYNTKIEKVLNMVTDESIAILKKSYHPRVLLIRNISVPSVVLRPDVKKYQGSRSNNNDLTTILKNIMVLLEKIPSYIDDEEMQKLDKNIKDRLDTIELHYFSLIKNAPASGPQLQSTTNNAKLISLSTRFVGKPGRIRGNLMSKRVFYMARSVISGDPNLQINEVGVPISIALNIQIPETVNSFNYKRLLVYFNNKNATYPGCTKIIKKKDNNEYDVNINKFLSLEIGDILYRDLIDGDDVALNRQPSLLNTSITSLKVKVMNVGNTIRLPINITNSLFSGDFDGDQMNIIFPHSVEARNECNKLMSVSRWFMSYKHGTPIVSIYHDGLLNTFMFTKNNIKINRFYAMKMIRKTKDLDWKNYKKDEYLSREIISKILPKINYKKKTSYYNPNYDGMIKYNDDQKQIVIKNGNILSGCLDKISVGEGVNDNIFHVIHNEYGADLALKTIYEIQQICSYYINHRGFTINYDDVLISEDGIKQIDEKTKDILNASDVITQKVKENQYITPINTNLEEYYERMQLASLNLGDDFLKPIFSHITCENNLYNLIASGTKGKTNNMLQISSAIGQTSIAGRRMAMNFSHGRTLPYFERFSMDPLSRGFVPDSYATGVNNVSFIFQAMEARVSITNKALSTADTGYQNRKSIKNLESNIIDNLRKTRKKYRIVQTLYGGDGVDTRYVEYVIFEKFLSSDIEFMKNYKADIKSLDPKYNNQAIKKMIEDEYSFLLEQRNLFRNIFKKIEDKNSKTKLMSESVKLSVNVKRIIENVCIEHEDYIKKVKLIDINPLSTIKVINKLINRLKYCYFNEIQYKKKMKIPEYINNALTLLYISIRSHLCLKNILEKKIDKPMLKMIVSKIIHQYNKSLIEAGTMIGILTSQSISENLTQYVLDSHHRAGVSNSDVDFIVRYKEITGARDTLQMVRPIMTIYLKPEYSDDVYKIKKIMNKIEMINFKTFIIICEIFYEKYGNIVHPDYLHENKMIKDFEKHNSKIIKPSNLSNYCIRIELDKEKMIEKNISLEKICFHLQNQYSFLFVVYNFENADTVVLRLYISSMFFKKKEFDDRFEEINKFIDKKLFNTIIHGIENIKATNLNTKLFKSVLTEDGSIIKKNVNVINTHGTNLDKIFENKYVDAYNTFSNSLIEIQDMLGIGAVKQLVMYELQSLIAGMSPSHYYLYAMEMCQTGFLTALERTGTLAREPKNILLHMSTSHALQVLESSAISNIKTDSTQSLSSSLMVSQMPIGGSNYNKVILNEKFIE